MVRLRATCVVEYDANPKYYDTADSIIMAKVDERDFVDDPPSFIEFLQTRKYSVKVEPV